MRSKRLAVGLLSLLLLALLGWSLYSGSGGARFQVLLGVGALLGLLFVAVGRLPDWILPLADGSLTGDDDPANLPVRIWLPVLLTVLAVAAAACFTAGLF